MRAKRKVDQLIRCFPIQNLETGDIIEWMHYFASLRRGTFLRINSKNSNIIVVMPDDPKGVEPSNLYHRREVTLLQRGGKDATLNRDGEVAT